MKFKINTITYSIIPSVIIMGTNSLLIYDFVRSKKKVYTSEQLKNSKSFRTNLRSTIVYACVYSISFVVISLPKMLVLLLGFAYRDTGLISVNLNTIFDLQGNLYYVFNFFFLAVMNKQFLHEVKSILRSIGFFKNQSNSTTITQNMSTKKN